MIYSSRNLEVKLQVSPTDTMSYNNILYLHKHCEFLHIKRIIPCDLEKDCL